MAQRKTQWIAFDDKGKVLGVFPSKKKAKHFFPEEDVKLTKLIWNGFYHSENPIQYDPYEESKVKLYVPMF